MTMSPISASGSSIVQTPPTALGLDFLREDQLAANVSQVLSFAGGSPDKPRRGNFMRALDELQPFPILSAGDPDIYFDFDPLTDPPKGALAHLMTVDQLPDGWCYSERERECIRATVDEALRWLEVFDPTISVGFKLIVGRLIFGKHPSLHGGSISDLIGAIWLSPKMEWTSSTYKENLVHEYIHNCIFLDDMVNSIFCMTVPEMVGHKVRSAVLRIPRGYDKSYHSAFVAWGLLQVRGALGLEIDDLAQSIRTTLDGLLDCQEPLSDRGRRHLLQLQDLVDDYFAR